MLRDMGRLQTEMKTLLMVSERRMQYNTVQYSGVQYNTVEYSTAE